MRNTRDARRRVGDEDAKHRAAALVPAAPVVSRVVSSVVSKSVAFAAPLARLTRLDLSHLPNVTDASVVSAVENLPSLTKLRLEFLPVTDACLGAGRGGWRAFLRNLTWLEIKSCPYVRFAHPAGISNTRRDD